VGGACRTHGRMRNADKSLVGKPEGKRQLGRSRGRWENNIRMDVTGIDWEHEEWIHLAQVYVQWRALS